MNFVISLAAVTPPSRLSSFQTARVASRENEVNYAVRCRCGSEDATIISEFDEHEQFWLEPLIYKCNACGLSTTLFDAREDGYDAVINGLSAYEPRIKDEPVSCSACGSKRHKVMASYQYDYADGEIEEEWGAEDRHRMPDVFSSAGFEVTCIQCGEAQWLGGYECA